MLIKNAEALERFEKVDTLVVDKTGTLTEGKPKVVALTPASGVGEERLAAARRQSRAGSEHPLAAAIVRAAADRGLALAKVEDFEFAGGQGRDRNRRRAQSRPRQSRHDAGGGN